MASWLSGNKKVELRCNLTLPATPFVPHILLPRSGTEYTLLNNSTMKEQVAGFVFDKISLTKQLKEGQIPRRLHCLLPPLAFDSTAIPYKINSDSDMVERFQNGIPGKMSVLNTKEPTFERGQYRLNFHGRVTTPSVKNFQIGEKMS